jgi:hypothetical protein
LVSFVERAIVHSSWLVQDTVLLANIALTPVVEHLVALSPMNNYCLFIQCCTVTIMGGCLDGE